MLLQVCGCNTWRHRRRRSSSCGPALPGTAVELPASSQLPARCVAALEAGAGIEDVECERRRAPDRLEPADVGREAMDREQPGSAAALLELRRRPDCELLWLCARSMFRYSLMLEFKTEARASSAARTSPSTPKSDRTPPWPPKSECEPGVPILRTWRASQRQSRRSSSNAACSLRNSRRQLLMRSGSSSAEHTLAAAAAAAMLAAETSAAAGWVWASAPLASG
mmetsp:Transcript_148655/g.259287  ORF Transcript_148655/g.259287 Transcript_148655/m.259287 type:complete len:224 (-) Transcript_148655:2035-2706(-)